jgi:hypothetical protein
MYPSLATAASFNGACSLRSCSKTVALTNVTLTSAATLCSVSFKRAYSQVARTVAPSPTNRANSASGIVEATERQVSSTQPSRTTHFQHEIKSQLHRLMAALAQQPCGLNGADIKQFVDLAIAAGQLNVAMELLEAAAAAETQGAVSPGYLLTSDVFHRLLTIATYSQNIDLGDKCVSMILQLPGSRLDVRVVELYATLVGDLHVPDIPRALAFCNLMLELGHNAFAPYLASMNRSHGEEGLRSAVEYFAADNMSIDALRCVQTALLNLGSGLVEELFVSMVDAAKQVAVEAQTDAATQLNSGERAEQQRKAETRSKRLLEEAHELTINGLLQLQEVDKASSLLFQGIRKFNLSLTYSTFLVAKKLVNVLSLEKPVASSAITSLVQEALYGTQTSALPAVSSHSFTPRIATLIRCLNHLITCEALRPRLLFNVRVVIIPAPMVTHC